MATKQGVQDPTPLEANPTEGAETLKENAPEPSDKAAHVVAPVFPISEFVIEGIPVLTEAGTPLTKAQLEDVKKVAKASGVRLMVDGEVQ